MSLESYSDVVAFCATARDISKGKPLMNWGRFTKKGDTYLLSVYDLPFVVFHPNNTLEFVISKVHSRQVSATLSAACQSHLPVVWNRKSMGVYEVRSTNTASIPEWERIKSLPIWEKLKYMPAHEVYEGLVIDLTTGTALNPKPNESTLINPDKRKEWLRALKKYKQSAKVRAKVGVFEGIISEVAQARQKNIWTMPDWDTPEWQDKLYQNILSGNATTDMLKAFVQGTNRWRWRFANMRTTPANVLTHIDEVCTQYSRELRRRFGVFGD